MIRVHTTKIIQFDHLQDVEDKVEHLWFVFLVRTFFIESSLYESEKGWGERGWGTCVCGITET